MLLEMEAIRFCVELGKKQNSSKTFWEAGIFFVILRLACA